MSIESSGYQNNFFKEFFSNLPQRRQKPADIPLHGINETRTALMIEEQRLLDDAKKIFPEPIVEKIEWIRSSGILISYEYNDLFSGKRQISPALISGNQDSITLHFNCGYRDNVEGLLDKGLPSSSDKITISKTTDNAFQLIYKDQDEKGSFNIFSTKPSDIINGILDVVEIKKSYKKRGCL